MSVPLPPGLDWEVWGVMSSEYFSIQDPNVIYEGWTLEQLADAWMTIDVRDELKRKASPPPPTGRKR